MSGIIHKKKLIKKPGIKISDYSFGAWAIGGNAYGYVPDESAKSVIRNYLDAGGNHIDTAGVYGESERIIGEVLKESSKYDDTILSTKSLGGQTLDTIPQLRRDLESGFLSGSLKKDTHFPDSDHRKGWNNHIAA